MILEIVVGILLALLIWRLRAFVGMAAIVAFCALFLVFYWGLLAGVVGATIYAALYDRELLAIMAPIAIVVSIFYVLNEKRAADYKAGLL